MCLIPRNMDYYFNSVGCLLPKVYKLRAVSTKKCVAETQDHSCFRRIGFFYTSSYNNIFGICFFVCVCVFACLWRLCFSRWKFARFLPRRKGGPQEIQMRSSHFRFCLLLKMLQICFAKWIFWHSTTQKKGGCNTRHHHLSPVVGFK